jgi:protein-S-isoprenylcysteine O-methyltransferase Ste14
MGDEYVFRVLFVVVYVLFACVRVYYRSKTIGRRSKKDYSEANKTMIVLAIGILGYLFSVVVYLLFPGFIGWAHIDLTILGRWAGVGFALAGVLLTFSAHRTLGKQYSALQEIQEEHLLISTEIYSRVRHPMYTGFILLTLGLAFVSSNLLLIVFAFLVVLPFPWIARKEEQMLLEHFGKEYRDYMRTTGRFFPPIKKPRQKESP